MIKKHHCKSARRPQKRGASSRFHALPLFPSVLGTKTGSWLRLCVPVVWVTTEASPRWLKLPSLYHTALGMKTDQIRPKRKTSSGFRRAISMNPTVPAAINERMGPAVTHRLMRDPGIHLAVVECSVALRCLAVATQDPKGWPNTYFCLSGELCSHGSLAPVFTVTLLLYS